MIQSLFCHVYRAYHVIRCNMDSVEDRIMRRRRNQFEIARHYGRRRSSAGLSFSQRKKGVDTAHMKAVAGWLAEILLAAAVAVLCVYFFGMRIHVVGQSMEPTLTGDETILINRFVYKLVDPKPNDLIVFLPNGNEKSHHYVKRVIAVPGDTVQIKGGKVYVNDQLFDEQIENPSIENGLMAEEPIVVEEGEFFVLGDNRNNSEDSRYANIGNVKKEYIEGKAWFIVSPFDKLGFIQ